VEGSGWLVRTGTEDGQCGVYMTLEGFKSMQWHSRSLKVTDNVEPFDLPHHCVARLYQ